MPHRLTLLAAAAVLLAGCGSEPDPEPAPNPVERRVEPVRSQTAVSDSLTRAHQERVAELVEEAQ